MVELEVTIVEAIIEAEVEVVETTTVIVVQEEDVAEDAVVVVIIDMTEKAVNPVFEDTEVVDGVGAAETEEEVVLVLIEIGHHLETEEDPIGTTVVECTLNEDVNPIIMGPIHVGIKKQPETEVVGMVVVL